MNLLKRLSCLWVCYRLFCIALSITLCVFQSHGMDTTTTTSTINEQTITHKREISLRIVCNKLAL